MAADAIEAGGEWVLIARSTKSNIVRGVLIIVTMVTTFIGTAFVTPRVFADGGPQCTFLNISCTADAPVLSGPSDHAYNPMGDFTWTDDQDSNNSLTFEICAAKNTAMTDNEVCKQTTKLSYAITDLISTNEGTWYWQVTALAGGLFSNNGVSAQQSLVLHVAPTATLLVNNSTTPAPVGHNASVEINGSVTGSQDVTCTITISTDPVTTMQCGDSQWATTDVPTGTYAITLTASDQIMAANNQPPVTQTVSIYVDNSGPDVTMNNDDVLAPDQGVDADITATDDSPGDLTYAWSDDGTNPEALVYDHNVAAPHFTPTVDGAYVFTVVVTDVYGNTTTKQFHLHYIADKPVLVVPTDPLPPVTAPPAPTPAPQVTAGATSTSTTIPISRRSEDSDETPAAAGTLGASTITNVVAGDTKDSAPIVATHQGWRILGILWYWWGVLIILGIAGFIIVRRMVLHQRPQDA